MFSRPVQRLATRSAKAPASAPVAPGPQTASAAPLIAHSIGTTLPVAPPERPNRTGLPDELKRGVETLSGVALDDVRVHRNSARPGALGAHAYAQGSHIHVAPGQEHNLPHEAWHVVQQKQGRVRATMQLKGGVAVNDDAALEREADAMGAAALSAPLPTAFGATPVSAPRKLAEPTAERQSMPVQRSNMGSADMEKALGAKQDVEEEEEQEEAYHSNEHGASIPVSQLTQLHSHIDAYDVNPEEDFRRGAAFGGQETNAIGVALGDLATFAHDKKSKGLKHMLDHVYHPAKGSGQRDKKYGGKTFNQILGMCAEGQECNNDLAKALRECLGTLSPDS